MRFSIYILLAAAMLWFVIASAFMYRSGWDRSKSLHHKNVLIEHSVKHRPRKIPQDIFTFRLQGLDELMGIYRKNEKNYEDFLNHMQIGDTVSVWYGDWRHRKGEINFQVSHLESRGKVLIDVEKRNNRDRMAALILYALCLLTGGAAWFFNRRFSKTGSSSAQVSGPF